MDVMSAPNAKLGSNNSSSVSSLNGTINVFVFVVGDDEQEGYGGV